MTLKLLAKRIKSSCNTKKKRIRRARRVLIQIWKFRASSGKMTRSMTHFFFSFQKRTQISIEREHYKGHWDSFFFWLLCLFLDFNQADEMKIKKKIFFFFSFETQKSSERVRKFSWRLVMSSIRTRNTHTQKSISELAKDIPLGPPSSLPFEVPHESSSGWGRHISNSWLSVVAGLKPILCKSAIIHKFQIEFSLFFFFLSSSFRRVQWLAGWGWHTHFVLFKS